MNPKCQKLYWKIEERGNSYKLSNMTIADTNEKLNSLNMLLAFKLDQIVREIIG
jgi:hypothetical protein